MPMFLSILCVPHRWIVCILCSLALAIINYKHICFYSVLNIVRSYTEPKTLAKGGCPFLFLDDSGINHKSWFEFGLPHFYKNSEIPEILNNAYLIGQFLAAVPAGALSDVGYSKSVLSGSMLLIAISDLLLPTVFEFGMSMNVVLSFVEGVGEGSIYPSVISLISRWSLPSERYMYTAIVMTGRCYGLGLGYVFFNFIYTSWGFGNRITGIIVLVWVALSLVFISHSPEDSTFISRNEHLHITGRNRGRGLLTDLVQLKEIPWRKIVISPSFLSLVLAYCSMTWAVFGNIYEHLVSYQRYILHLPAHFVMNNSPATILAVLPSLLMGGILADWITKHRPNFKTVIKRVFAFISVFCPSVLLCARPLVGCNIILFGILTTSALYTFGFALSTLYSAAVDQSRRHAGLLMGIMFVSRTSCHILHTRIVEYIVLDNNNPNHHMNRVFVFAILAFAMIIPFLFVGSRETQDWRRPVLSVTHPTLLQNIALETSETPRLVID